MFVPFGDERLEVIVQSKFGYGNTVIKEQIVII
jgi:hypothetical protein